MSGILLKSLTREPEPTNAAFRYGGLLVLLAGIGHTAWFTASPSFAEDRAEYALIWFALLVNYLAFVFRWPYRTRVALRAISFAATAALLIHVLYVFSR